jgi:glycosyltransferase involved in cell wall biosynthesis
MKPKSITAFFPAYNDGGTIGQLVMVALETLPKITDDYEVLVVNDGSRDGTADVLDRLARQNPRVRVIHHTRNRGYGGALRSGFANARKEWIFYTDGDGQYDPRELLQLIAVWRDDLDLVNGYKLVRHDPLYRVVIGRAYHYFARLAFGIRAYDVDCDFRLIRRALFDRVELESDTGAICVEMIKKFQDNGCRFAHVPVHHYHRVCGSSEFFRPRRLWRVAVHLSQLWWKLIVRRDHRVMTNAPNASADTLPITHDASA